MYNCDIISELQIAISTYYSQKLKDLPKEKLDIWKASDLVTDEKKIREWLTQLRLSLNDYGFKPTDYAEKLDSDK